MNDLTAVSQFAGIEGSHGADLGLFGGPGGWATGARALGTREAGIEWDAAACATRRAAGHDTIRADVSQFPVEQLAGKVRGISGSPPCKLYSAAGTGIGRLVIGIVAAAIPRILDGDECRDEVRAQIYPVALGYRQAENEAREPSRRWAEERVEAAARNDAFEASLVLEPARYIRACHPGWVALEQVPAVLPLWEVYASELRTMGYSAWCGKLNAADYGVPQTRERAILIASHSREVRRPEPTHYDTRKGLQLWGTPWVSMAQALGWGATGRPVPTVTAGGTQTGGAEPFGHRGRDALEAARDAGEWALRIDAQAHATLRSAAAPAPALKFGHSAAEMQWVLHRARGASVDRRDDPADEPAPTITSAGGKAGANLTWKFRNNNNNACVRSLDEPAGTLFFGQRSNWAAWVTGRPSTTLTTDQRVFVPHAGSKGESHSSDPVRITVQEAALLQSFPADYPWQGSKTASFRMVGDAVPPLFAIHVLGMAAGIDPRDAAERYSETVYGSGWEAA